MVVVAASLLPLLPWHYFSPILDFIGRHPWLNAFAKSFVVLNFVALHVMFLIWLERKFAGWMQARLGPKHVGWQGLLQSVADAIKLFLKEDIIPSKADHSLFVAAPFLTFMPTLLTFMVLPFSAAWIAYDYSMGVLFVVAVSTNVALGILAAGWGANNKYSILGGARAVAQLLSYEIPMVMIILAVVTLSDTMSMKQIVLQQQHGWNIVTHWEVMIPGFIIFLICALAELNRTPFDLPEAESELVSGFHTEYSGMRFAFFYLAEFANNFFSAGFAVTLFFGGWYGPILPSVVWFALKTLILICLMMWIRWTMPRLRIDQVMGFCWKALVPASLVVFCLTALLAVR
jgi:NADH-quinone oxidoreductase subunit H